MTSPYLAFDGKSLKTAPSFASAIQDKFYGGDVANAAVVAGLDAQKAYKLVPWLYRAVTLRAYHVSRFPFALLTEQGKDVTTDPAYASLLANWRTRLWLTEASKVVGGAAYWAIEANAYGRNITPRYLPSQSVQPRYDTTVGLTHFYFSGNYHAELAREIPLDRMVWFWEPNISDEVSPGPAPAAVALAAASMLYALDAFTANFFNRGAVKVTVFEIPASTSDADKNAFNNWLQRSVAGVRKAFQMLPVRGGVKPTVIGSDVKDTQAPELTDLQRDNVAAALGVPASVIDGRSSDDSNSRSEKLAFVTDTIIPEVEMLFETANEKLFKQFKLKLVAQPEKLEIMQAQQLDQVTAVTEAVGKPVLLEHEGRALLGYPPVEQAEKAYDEQLAALGLTREPKPAPVAPPVPGQPAPDAEQPMDPGAMEPVKAADVVHPGAMLAFMLHPDERDLLMPASVNGNEPDHLTLVFLAKDASQIDSNQMAALVTVLKTFAKRCAPFTARLGGSGRFATVEGDGTNAIYASVDSPALPGFREELLELVRSTGIEPPANHGFTPHVTLGYVAADRPTPKVALPEMLLFFGTLTLMAAGHRTDFRLMGTEEFKALEPVLDDSDEVKQALGEWRKTVLDNLKAGGSQTMLPDLVSIPKRLRDRLFADLATAKTPAAVRAVFARHWPKSAAKAEPTLAEVMAELRAARLAAEKVAA